MFDIFRRRMVMSKKLISRSVITVVLLLSTLGLGFSMINLVKAAWEPYTGDITLDNQPYVVDSCVTYNGSGYEMWYTHAELSISSYIDAVKSLDLAAIITDITNMNVNALLNDLSNLDPATLANLLTETNMAIGYATSADGKSWSRIDPAVLGGSGDTYKRVGTPTVIYNGTGYEMWFTNFTTDLNQTKIQSIQTGLAGNAAQRKTAILDLLHSTSMSIGYATSSNGIDWTIENASVLSGNGSLLDSYSTPSVVIDGSTYKMWYTRFKTDYTETNLDALLADVGQVDVSDLWDILDSTTTVIGYATSTDGETWSGINNQIFPAASGGIWDSASAPCVIETDGSYEMWYTSAETDLTTDNFSDLFRELSSLPFASLLNSLKTMSLNDFFSDLLTLDISNIKDLLSGTSSAVGYATSDDGITWTVQNSKLVTGTGGASASIGAPTVVKTPIAYEMWYTEGMPDITLQNVISLLDGSVLPIGYASLETGATVEISVGLMGNRDLEAQCIMPVTIKLFTPGADVMSDTPVYSINTTTVKSGDNAANATVTGIAPGIYDITIVSEHTLTNVKKNVVISAPYTPVNMGTLLEGDANSSGKVDILDVSTLIPAYGKSSGDPGYNPLTDFDRSGKVDILDVSTLIPSYGKQSPILIP
jgi:hypothetical protein